MRLWRGKQATFRVGNGYSGGNPISIDAKALIAIENADQYKFIIQMALDLRIQTIPQRIQFFQDLEIIREGRNWFEFLVSRICGFPEKYSCAYSPGELAI